MRQTHHISISERLSLKDVFNIISNDLRLRLGEDSLDAINRCRTYLDEKVADGNTLYYGINTGFGSLCDVPIAPDQLELLQTNLVMSHACGSGDIVPEHMVKIMLLLKIQSLSFGYSGVQAITVERLVDFYNHDIIPLIFEQGSLGASGDLAPLAHLSLPLLGKGYVLNKGKKYDTETFITAFRWDPIKLKSKEGLALLNGTQFSTSYGVYACIEGSRLLALANFTSALSVDAFECVMSPFDERIHAIRPHLGQNYVASYINKILEDSAIAHAEKDVVQDPYAFRCIPQVHGASMDALHYVKGIIETEINAVTDNPNVFIEDDTILSGGNFHAQPIALSLDFLAIALSELGSISERRTYQLISGKRELPQFLTPDPGINSGMMIPQYLAASIVSQNKQLCTPASVDSIVSCNGQEDHVSMAANAGTKLYKVIQNLETLIAIEWMTAAQALAFRRPRKSGSLIEKYVEKYRQVVPILESDRILHDDIEKTKIFLRQIKTSDINHAGL